MFAHSIRGSIPSKRFSTRITLLLLVVSLGLGASCSLTPPSFDEAAWKAKAQSADPALLYAPHFKDDLFFNPWMPDGDKSLLSVLRWRLTASQEYTEEEKRIYPVWWTRRKNGFSLCLMAISLCGSATTPF